MSKPKRIPVNVVMNTSNMSRAIGRISKKTEETGRIDKSDALNIFASEILGQNQNWGGLLHQDGLVIAQGVDFDLPPKTTEVALVSAELGEIEYKPVYRAGRSYKHKDLRTMVTSEQDDYGRPYIQLQSAYGNEDRAENTVRLYPDDKVVDRLSLALRNRGIRPDVVTIDDVTFFFSDKDVGAVASAPEADAPGQEYFPNISDHFLAEAIKRFLYFSGSSPSTRVSITNEKLHLQTLDGAFVTVDFPTTRTLEVFRALDSADGADLVSIGKLSLAITPRGITGVIMSEKGDPLIFPNVSRSDLKDQMSQRWQKGFYGKQEHPTTREAAQKRVFSAFTYLADAFHDFTEFLGKNPRTNDEIMAAIISTTYAWSEWNDENLKIYDEDELHWDGAPIPWETIATTDPERCLDKLQDNFLDLNWDGRLLSKLDEFGHQPETSSPAL